MSCDSHYSSNNIGVHVSRATVKMVKIDNEASVSDQGFHLSIKLIVNTLSEQLCALMGWSNVDLKS